MDEVLKALVNSGVSGAILAFFLWRLEPRLRAIEDAIGRQGKIDLLRLAASPHVAPELKEAAKDLIKEIEIAQSTK